MVSPQSDKRHFQSSHLDHKHKFYPLQINHHHEWDLQGFMVLIILIEYLEDQDLSLLHQGQVLQHHLLRQLHHLDWQLLHHLPVQHHLPHHLQLLLHLVHLHRLLQHLVHHQLVHFLEHYQLQNLLQMPHLYFLLVLQQLHLLLFTPLIILGIQLHICASEDLVVSNCLVAKANMAQGLIEIVRHMVSTKYLIVAIHHLSIAQHLIVSNHLAIANHNPEVAGNYIMIDHQVVYHKLIVYQQ